MASANRDGAVFAEPDHFDILRRPNPHLSFVAGPHICPGAHLSRQITQIVLTVLLERFEGIKLAPGGQMVPAGMLGIDHLPVMVSLRTVSWQRKQ
jgi:cytochrome P450